MVRFNHSYKRYKVKTMYPLNPYHYRPAIPRNGLVGEWLFKGNANDTSGNANHGTVSGATLTTGRTGVANTAYSFTNATDLINCGTGSTLRITGNLTMSYWINGTPNATYGRHVCKEACYGTNAEALSGAIVRWFGSGIDARLNTGVNVPVLTSAWHHVVIVYNGSNIQLYFDGQFIAQIAKTGALTDSASVPVTIGNRVALDRASTASFTDVRLYNRVLTVSEITTLYNE